MANAPQFPRNPLPTIIGGTVNVLAAGRDFPVTIAPGSTRYGAVVVDLPATGLGSGRNQRVSR